MERVRFERSWCGNCACCIAAVRSECSLTLPRRSLTNCYIYDCSKVSAVAWGLQVKAIAFSCCGARIGVDTIENFARLAGALSLLASSRMGRGGEWRRTREKVEPMLKGATKPRYPGGEASPAAPSGGAERRRHFAWLARTLTLLWVATLLFIVGYAAVKGESALADLDQLDLVTTYALAP